MRDLLLLIAHLITAAIKIIAPGGARAVITVRFKHQLPDLNRSRKKGPEAACLGPRFEENIIMLDASCRRLATNMGELIIRATPLLWNDLLLVIERNAPVGAKLNGPVRFVPSTPILDMAATLLTQ